ncbi:MAG TPA: hypothetical protein VMC83_36415 [Streptosporangiaceae bacterium]|nr:hypothetical protein [Streptosporangiaceae bacterium]
MSGNREERNRVLGFPVERHPNTRPARKPRGPQQAEQPQGRPQPGQPQQAEQPQGRTQAKEPQRVLGIPADWLDQIADEALRPLLRRIRSWGRK